MIICTNCNHENPEGSVQCENCYAPLSQTSSCPHCGAITQINAAFCGQCGYNLLSEEPLSTIESEDDSENLFLESDELSKLNSPEKNTIKEEDLVVASPWETDSEGFQDSSEISSLQREAEPEIEITDEVEALENLVEPEELASITNADYDDFELDEEMDLDTNLDLALEEELPEMSDIEELEETTARVPSEVTPINPTPPSAEPEIDSPDLDLTSDTDEIPEALTLDTSKSSPISQSVSWSQPIGRVTESATQLQLERIILSHVQTGTDIELAQNLDIIRIGKPNSQIPPDIDVSGFPDANIVSRVHANIRVEGDSYFVEDAGSSNGTYINHKPLLTGNRHRLRFGDRISLGKGDLMTFIFKIIDY